MVAQNPSILQPMLHELGKTNPELFRQINEHQQDFLRLLTEEQVFGMNNGPEHLGTKIVNARYCLHFVSLDRA